MAKSIALTASEYTVVQDITLWKGEAPTLTFTLSPVVDATLWTVTFTVKRRATDAAALVSIGGTITSGPSGIFTIALTSVQTKTTLGVGLFAYDVQRTNAGSENVLSVGRLVIKQESLN